MKKSESLVFKVKVLGLLLSFLMVILALSSLLTVYFDERRRETKKAIELYNNYEKNNEVAQKLRYKVITNINEIKMVKKEGVFLLFDEVFASFFKENNLSIFVYEEHYYIFLEKSKYYFKSEDKVSSLLSYISVFLLIISSLIYLLIFYIRKSLFPLKTLYKKIVQFGHGNKKVDTRLNGNDEVSQVGNAFYQAIQNMRTLENNRELFIRNIIHELRTPLMKNNLLIYTLSEKDDIKNKLLANNKQINTTVDMINQFDSLESDCLHLEKKYFNIIDVVEEAIEDSELSSKVFTLNIISTSKQNLDFRRMVFCIKNLILNAYIHGSDKKVKINVASEYIEVINKTKDTSALNFKDIRKAFFKNNTNTGGMGLGMYIIYELIKLHEFALVYTYEKNKLEHKFKVVFKL